MDPNNHILFSNRANIYSQKSEHQKALNDAEKCIQLNPKFGKGYVRKADALKALNKVEDAMTTLEDGMKNDPNEPLLKQRQESFMNDFQNQFTTQIFGRTEQELSAKMNNNPKIKMLMAQDPTLFMRANQARQNPNFLQTMQQDPVMQQLIVELLGLGDKLGQKAGGCQDGGCQDGGCKQQCGDKCCKKTGGPCCKDKPAAPKEQPKEEVKEEAKVEVNEEQKKADELKNQGNEMFKNGKYEEALELYQKAFDTFKSIVYLNNISTAFLKMEKYELALEKAVEACEFGRDHGASFQEIAKALAKQGSALHKLQRFEEAIDKLKSSMLEFRDKQTLALQNKVEEDFAAYKLKKLYDVELAKKLKDEAAVLMKNSKFIDAIEKYTNAMEHLPEALQDGEAKVLCLQLHNNRSIALFKAGQIHASYEDCLFVLKQEPENIKALLRKAQIERMRKQYYLSVETYTEVMRLDQTNQEGYEGYTKTQQKINEMQSGSLTEQEMKEIADIAMADESMQKLAQDPGMAQVLKQIQQNPAAAQQYLSDQSISKKLQRLINAGVIRMGRQQ